MSDHVHENLHRLMAERGWSAREVAGRSGLDGRTIRGILRGTNRPRAATLHRLAEGLGVKVEELFLDPALLLHRRFDRATNPAVEQLVDEQPELFAGWSERDFDELHSRVGAGGPLSAEGARQAAEHINRKRELHHKLDLILESSQSRTVGGVIELLYDQVIVAQRRRGDE
jgi:transcriptional regulator with XRE-family HTH domain